MTGNAERIVLASRPVGEPTLGNFRLEEFAIPQPGPGRSATHAMAVTRPLHARPNE